MALSIYPIASNFVAEIGDVDLSRPLSLEDREAIKQAFWKYAVLIFPEQTMTQQQHVDFATIFGPLETTIQKHRTDEALRIREDIADVSNLDANNRVWGETSRQRMFQLGNRLWHTDSTFRKIPAKASLLYGRTVAPIGGHTEFADMRAAYDALPETMRKRIDGLIVEHSIFTSRAKLGFTGFSDEERAALPPVPQVMVRTIPENDRKSLYLASHAGRVFGLPDAEAAELLETLTAHATQRQFVYTHRWRQHDLLIWDNRCTMHRGTEFDDLRWKRDMQRATVSEPANSCEIAGVAVPVEA
ncbi:MAG: 2,4-dichlorophenoxyacetate dioxygenase [Variovorax paradoxus]|uniref:2,4-dichlorophenoxyacetate dioxygenase n=1 Tax=Variovorax paradoxus TaxID=34073 RepID=A0A2W5QJ94_VARPD|nr:MAG: 2,4-dichlorophenoxyacetate dioxygenase [Variovorax paradoxus]